jgi:hypothetical protein
MRWPAAKKTPFWSSILAITVAAMCDASCSGLIRTKWKRSVNGMRAALTAESAGRRYQQVTLSLLSRPNVFDAARIQMPPQPNFVLAGIE